MNTSQKLAPGALSTDVLNQIIYYINDIAAKNNYNKFVHEPADLNKLEVSFIHCQEEHTIILILHVPFIEADHLLTLYEFVSLPIHFNFSTNISVVLEVRWTSSPSATQICFKLFRHRTSPAVNVWALLSSVKAAPSSRPTSSTTALSFSLAQH